MLYLNEMCRLVYKKMNNYGNTFTLILQALDMIDNIKETFYETLVEIDWMDADMKEFAREKV